MSRPTTPLFKFVADEGVTNFIETGLWHGGGVRTALQCGYSKVYSFEIAEELIEENNEKFKSEISEGAVELIFGDSAVAFPELLPSVKGPAIYWLDAHFQGIEAEFDAANCPLNEEISAIIERNNPGDVILIDDLRLLKDKTAWRGHQTEIDRVIGDLLLKFPDSVAFLLEGYQQHDVFCLMPSAMASKLFAAFPNLTFTPETAPTHASVTKNKPIYVVAGGNNSRIGNLMPVYGRLMLKASKIDRPVRFPFIEKALSEVFDFIEPVAALDDAEALAMRRLLRSAQESVEKTEGAEPHKFSLNKLHEVKFESLDAKVLFSRGEVDWDAAFASEAFQGDNTIILSDPFPLLLNNVSLVDSIRALKPRMDFKPELIEAARARLSDPSRPTICIHWRQGDFERWANGAFHFQPAQMREMLSVIMKRFAAIEDNPQFLIVSDGDVDEALFGKDAMIYQGPSADCFAMVAQCRWVFSNSSTFSHTASVSGRVFLKNESRYINLGRTENAVKRMNNHLDKLHEMGQLPPTR